MAIIESKYVESEDGIKKKIDKGSMGMALDILQRGLYAHPIQSTIRELASNGYDAVIERDVAKTILSGESPVEDHYDVTKTEGIFHSSRWDPTYFDLEWLSNDPNVYLYYDEGIQKDTLRIADHGVGLGQNRLVNYFMLNWSSKRANKDSLGRFGLGSKVALSLGVDSFRVITKYNGKKFKFDVFLDKVESVIPKFDAKGNPNQPFVLVKEKTELDDEGNEVIVPAYVAYSEDTADKNGVEIQIEVKKHNKKLFFEAVESQLMYMPNIKFKIKASGSSIYQDQDIAAKILYKDDNVVISESTVFDKPHILLGTGDALINYGFVSFKDLEIEPKRGSVGLIMDINDIEVTPSRESPLWSAKTRTAVLDKYKMVTQMASTYLNNELASETDYLSWIVKSSQVLGSIRHGGNNNATVLSRLASIIDVDSIGAVSFPTDSTIKYDNKPKTMLGDTLTVRGVLYDKWSKKIQRKVISDVSSLTAKIYFTKTGSDPFKDRYLYEEFGKFILINIKEGATADKLGQLVIASPLLHDYEDVEVPEDRMDLYLSGDEIGEDDDDGTAARAAVIDYSARRKENKQIVIHELSGEGSTHDYKFTSHDVFISDLFSRFEDELVIYTTGGDRASLSELLAVFPKALLSTTRQSKLDEYVAEIGVETVYDRKIKGVLFAQENLKYIKNSTKYISMSDVMVKKYDEKTGMLEFSDILKETATNSFISRYMRDKFGNMARISNTNTKYLSEELYNLAEFIDDYFANYYDGPARDMMNSGFLKNAVMYQIYTAKILPTSDETIEELKEALNNQLPDYLCDVVDEIEHIDILDLDRLKECMELTDYYAIGSDFIELFRHESSYATESLKRMGPMLNDYIAHLNNTKEA